MLKMTIFAAALAVMYAALSKTGTSTAATTLTVAAGFIATLIVGLMRDA